MEYLAIFLTTIRPTQYSGDCTPYSVSLWSRWEVRLNLFKGEPAFHQAFSVQSTIIVLFCFFEVFDGCKYKL